MIINKLRIIEALTAAVNAKGCIDFRVNCTRWDTILNLGYGSTRMHLKAAADAAGYDAVESSGTFALTFRIDI